MTQSQGAYPYHPGFRRTDTSKAAADDIAHKQPTIQQQVLAALKEHGPCAAYELADILNRSYRSVQPRTSELAKMGKIYDCNLRRIDPDTGKQVIVWAILPNS